MPAFTPGNIVVYRVGTGTAPLGNFATEVFLDEYTSAGLLVQSIALPTVDSGANQTLTATGFSTFSTNEGLISRSADGRYIVLAGYDAAVGTAAPFNLTTGGGSPTLRVIGRVDEDGVVDTSATTTAFNSNAINGVTSLDGTGFWITGASGGIRYQPYGGGAFQQIATTPGNGRALGIFDEQLYVSSGVGGSRGVLAVGSGLPVTGPVTSTRLPGLTDSNNTFANQFFLADLDVGVAGLDTLYIADDGRGLQKFSLVGGSWTLNGTIGVDADDYRGLTASVSGTTVTIYATRKAGTTAAGGGEIVSLIDTGGYNNTFSTVTPALLATAATNTIIRGIAFTPLAATTGSGDPETFTGTPDSDAFDGLGGDDLFLLQQGGFDSADGGLGNDGFYFGAELGAGDSVDGGGGSNDQIGLQGSYSGVSLAGANFTGVEAFALLAGSDTRFGDTAGNFYDYLLTLTGAWSGNTIFTGAALQVGEDMIIDASATTSGSFTFFGGASVDSLTGGVGNDGFFFSPATIDPLDFINGGGGTDNQVALRGNFTGAAAVSFGPGQLTNIQTISVLSTIDARYGRPGEPAYSYSITLQDGATPGVEQLTVTGAGLRADEALTVDGSLVMTGSLRLIGGAGDDELVGSDGDDILFGGLNRDDLTGGGGSDQFMYTSTAQSGPGGPNRDVINAFSEDDLIDLSAIDADSAGAGDQFAFIGTAAFSGVAGQLRYTDAGGGQFLVQADTDGNSMADMEILVVRSDAQQMVAGDFVL